MGVRTICRRCHRLKAVSAGGYCANCAAGLRSDEQPVARVSLDQAAAVIADAAARKAAAAHAAPPVTQASPRVQPTRSGMLDAIPLTCAAPAAPAPPPELPPEPLELEDDFTDGELRNLERRRVAT